VVIGTEGIIAGADSVSWGEALLTAKDAKKSREERRENQTPSRQRTPRAQGSARSA
jgi:hypothetical protein